MQHCRDAVAPNGAWPEHWCASFINPLLRLGARLLRRTVCCMDITVHGGRWLDRAARGGAHHLFSINLPPESLCLLGQRCRCGRAHDSGCFSSGLGVLGVSHLAAFFLSPQSWAAGACAAVPSRPAAAAGLLGCCCCRVGRWTEAPPGPPSSFCPGGHPPVAAFVCLPCHCASGDSGATVPAPHALPAWPCRGWPSYEEYS